MKKIFLILSLLSFVSLIKAQTATELIAKFPSLNLPLTIKGEALTPENVSKLESISYENMLAHFKNAGGDLSTGGSIYAYGQTKISDDKLILLFATDESTEPKGKIQPMLNIYIAVYSLTETKILTRKHLNTAAYLTFNSNESKGKQVIDMALDINNVWTLTVNDNTKSKPHPKPTVDVSKYKFTADYSDYESSE